MSGLIEFLQSRTNLSLEEIEYIFAGAILHKLKRNEFVLRQGETCRYKIFVHSGLLRSFHSNVDGSEHIIRFSQENTWVTDKESFDLQAPSSTSISAVEPSLVLL